MGLFRSAARAYLANRLLRGDRSRAHYHRHSGYGSRHARRRSSGFGMWGPFPSYSRRTRGGSRVRVSGCCLPLPLAFTVGSAVALSRALRSR
jgi:hypothetical protein